MSKTKTKITEFHPSAKPVVFGLSALAFKNLDDLAKLDVSARLHGRVGGTTGIVETKSVRAGIAEVKAGLTTAEKVALRQGLAGLERVLCEQDHELADEPHDPDDLFVDNT